MLRRPGSPVNFFIQPKKYESLQPDEGSRAIMQKTIDFFEHMGKQRLLSDFDKRVWYREFIDFIGREQIFSKLLTRPSTPMATPTADGTRRGTASTPSCFPSTAWATGIAFR